MPLDLREIEQRLNAAERDWHGEPNSVLAGAADLLTELRAARKALERHGKHLPDCTLYRGIGIYQPPKSAVCTCGLAAALARCTDGGDDVK